MRRGNTTETIDRRTAYRFANTKTVVTAAIDPVSEQPVDHPCRHTLVACIRANHW